ncbi:DUF305 domain-containing protein [Actinomadura craniellae]|uniref:DUF305 domain-containing protein n=1 Tax=Actinomadura craniellae TaxID=2231787 RepID=A0A365HE23_9ACTN|nr:DUF305 domain-containing protein [Actinomadura craniellae]RAY17327.1 DUF305 domain-containing protein [Actinomadura craniellae]
MTEAESASAPTGPARPGRWAVAALLALVLVAAGAFTVPRLFNGDRPAPDGPEAGFARDMSAHHAQAVRMAFAVRDRSDDEKIRTLAYDIITTQQSQIGMMSAWLDGWRAPHADPAGPMRWMGGHGGHGAPGGTMPGMATREQLDELEHAQGRAAETLFLDLMITHHRGGVSMARAVLSRTGRPEVLRLARSMVEGQQSEIDLMTRMRAERNADRPGG